MITRDESQAIFQRVKDNHATLDACVGPHDFSIPALTHGTLIRRYRCTLCGGEIDHVDRTWYLRGLAHGRAPR